MLIHNSNLFDRVPDKRIVKPVYPELSALDVVEYVFHISGGFRTGVEPFLLLGDLFADSGQLVRKAFELGIILCVVVLLE